MAEEKKITVTGTTDTRTMDNSKLVNAIKEMKANMNPETQNAVINEALRSTFLVPAILETSQELVADDNNHVKFQDKQTAKFVLLKHSKNGNFFPAFTSMEEFRKMKSEQPLRPFSMTFGDIAGLTEQTPNVEGFVVNPFNENLPFTKNMLASIKQTLIRVNEERRAAKAAEEAASEDKSGE